jgi:Flp pilus assembly protein TadG
MRVRTKQSEASQPPRGVVMLELALVLTILLMLLVAVIDLGRFTYFYVALTQSVGAGARYASFHPVTTASTASYNAATRNAVLDDMQGVWGYDAADLTVSNPVVVTESDSYKFRRVSLAASYQFQPVVAWPGLPSTITLTRTVTMRVVR